MSYDPVAVLASCTLNSLCMPKTIQLLLANKEALAAHATSNAHCSHHM